MRVTHFLLAAILFMSVGCVSVIETPRDDRGTTDPVDTGPYVNTYLSIPYSIKALIAPYVEDYFSPSLSRYGEYLYPSYVPYDPYDLPCYVRADFNGDYVDDYAFLFSMEEWYGGCWWVTTRLLVVLSTSYGYVISCDLNLGTVYADACVPVEEFWSICYVPPGYHTLITWINGVEIRETVYLDNDAIFLASLDQYDEAIFYAIGDDMYEIEWVSEKLAKRSVASIQKKRNTIPFKKETEGRKRMLQK